jgi:hypothetical protein
LMSSPADCCVRVDEQALASASIARIVVSLTIRVFMSLFSCVVNRRFPAADGHSMSGRPVFYGAERTTFSFNLPSTSSAPFRPSCAGRLPKSPYFMTRATRWRVSSGEATLTSRVMISLMIMAWLLSLRDGSRRNGTVQESHAPSELVRKSCRTRPARAAMCHFTVTTTLR